MTHGLVNRAIQCFVQDTYGRPKWEEAARHAGLDFLEFESMLHYEEAETEAVLDAVADVLDKPRDTVLEDIGTYLVSHPNLPAIRRLLRFGGVDFIDFLHSLDDLQGRAFLAVPDLELPQLELREHGGNRFSLTCTSAMMGFGLVVMGLLRGMADDYGALVFLEMRGRGGGTEIIEIVLVQTEFAEAREFALGEGLSA